MNRNTMKHKMLLGFQLLKRSFVSAVFFFSLQAFYRMPPYGKDNDSAIKIAISLSSVLVSAVFAVKE